MAETVELCDINFGKLHELETGSFEGILRRNEPGSWRCDFQLDEVPPAKLMQVNAVLVRDEARILFAGYRAAAGGGQGGTLREIDDQGRRCAIEGVDCWHWLTTRLAFPNPATDPPWAVAVDARTGTGSAVIAAYVNANAGSTALPGRAVPGLTVNTSAPGLNVEQSARLQPLSEVVRAVADKARLVVEPTLTTALTPHIDIREASDRTASLVLADISDLAYAEQRDVPAEATWVLAAGTGAGASRVFREAGGGEGVTRTEKLVENTTASTTTELQQYAEAIRREAGFAFYVSGRTNEDAAEQYVYLNDYRLGDLVTVQVQGLRFPVPITEVTIRVSPERTVQTPTLGTYTPDRLRGLRRLIDDGQQRFDDNIA